MKKNRFKNWLIHKLGGYTKEDIDNQPIKYNVVNIKLETINAVYNLNEYSMLNFSEEYVENMVKKQLKNQLLDHIKPELILEDDCLGKRVKAKIELPSKYVK